MLYIIYVCNSAERDIIFVYNSGVSSKFIKFKQRQGKKNTFNVTFERSEV